MIVQATPLTTTVRPTAAGSALNRRRQSASLRTTLFGEPTLSSPGRNTRPSAALTRNTLKSDADTAAPKIRSGSPLPVTVNDAFS
jgi:hypothetical protein